MTQEDLGHLLTLLETLESGVLSLETNRDPAVAIHGLFQSAHNLKSGLAMVGLERASRRLHGLEDGLDNIRRGRVPWSDAWADSILETVDLIKTCLDANDDEKLNPEFETPAPVSPAVKPTSSSFHPVADGESLPKAAGEKLFRIEKLFHPGLSRDEFEGHIIYDDIRDNGTLVSVVPSWDEYSRASGSVVVRYVFSSSKSFEELGELFFDPIFTETPAAGTRPRFRILVVDDDRMTAQVIQLTLQTSDDVEVVFTGHEAIGAVRQAFAEGKPYDVVILDLMMPGLDGHETLQSLRDEEELHGVFGLDRCLIFMHTANPDLEKVKTSFRFQADRYFIKPLAPGRIKEDLEKSVPWLLARRKPFY
jgi:two-component system chemotaxis response regulator CheY